MRENVLKQTVLDETGCDSEEKDKDQVQHSAA
jgi:hypothetical protein